MTTTTTTRKTTMTTAAAARRRRAKVALRCSRCLRGCTEGVRVEFLPDAIERLAGIAFEVNERQENIGARRLHTVMERLLDTISFDAPDRGGSSLKVDAAYVDQHLGDLVRDQDLSRYIL